MISHHMVRIMLRIEYVHMIWYRYGYMGTTLVYRYCTYSCYLLISGAPHGRYTIYDGMLNSTFRHV